MKNVFHNGIFSPLSLPRKVEELYKQVNNASQLRKIPLIILQFIQKVLSLQPFFMFRNKLNNRQQTSNSLYLKRNRTCKKILNPNLIRRQYAKLFEQFFYYLNMPVPVRWLTKSTV